MTPQQFAEWRSRLGLTKVSAAKQLGISVGSVALYERGTRFDSDRPVEIPLIVALATEALTLRRFS